MIYKNYKIPTQLKNDVWAFLKDNNLGNRHEFNGNKTNQFVGLIGEIMVKMLFGIKHEWTKGFDGGFDFQFKGLKIDVKTMARNVNPKPEFVFNLVEHQMKFDCDIYIFCSLNKRTNKLAVCGYLSKTEFLEKSTLIKKGQTIKRSNGTTFVLKTNGHEIQIKEFKELEKLFYYLPKY